MMRVGEGGKKVGNVKYTVQSVMTAHSIILLQPSYILISSQTAGDVHLVLT